ncbi:UBP-type zinc finger domain-containing protein [uncultured Streptomyces sp.]|uniref:UBP-type zinc finger domain-containing protein n=1 Tax=uncultured Streptomyces sp. TaxID=174707 RepID=UPI0026275A81|nr:UBP-type zinc finger domain-containing protein [uncultured Streptomyces sp.]
MAPCPHLNEADAETVPLPPVDACGECVALGRTDWVHLRLCLGCGKVACCDSSPMQHATAHFTETGHPVMRSFEQGEDWRWCFVHSLLG